MDEGISEASGPTSVVENIKLNAMVVFTMTQKCPRNFVSST